MVGVEPNWRQHRHLCIHAVARTKHLAASYRVFCRFCVVFVSRDFCQRSLRTVDSSAFEQFRYFPRIPRLFSFIVLTIIGGKCGHLHYRLSLKLQLSCRTIGGGSSFF
ncbi:uncharacterized protein LOC122528964 [Frieseomelitta varia]|uniref:uncharacterized protein LOC122528964 n=1 Tax=Frieseomelitta varia TaxID=561572 RepID=UPI001CB6821E|nr:uncharacterized protein LOC122528964 [Frieseomelitta varia]